MSENMEREWLQSIHDVCIDYDGYRDVKGLKRLIDDIKQMTKDALEGKEPYLKLEGDAGNE
jgi:hypothetical protein